MGDRAVLCEADGLEELVIRLEAQGEAGDDDRPQWLRQRHTDAEESVVTVRHFRVLGGSDGKHLFLHWALLPFSEVDS